MSSTPSNAQTFAKQRFALVDCNNFYVSCERLFRPDLKHRPVAVLSNNDGCIVARSQEVKDLGIKMAVPLHQVQDLVDRHQVHLFSSNYTLYADISKRVMSLLAGYADHQEVYSIDESFLDLSRICDIDSEAYGQTIRRGIKHDLGMPVCVGMGPTKTLAKLANYAAKKWPQTGGVVDLTNSTRRQRLLRITPVCEIWGIGSRLSAKLNQMGIDNAWQLASLSPDAVRSQFNVTVARTAVELNGVSCLSLEEINPDKQQFVCSRSFRQRLTTYDQLAEALTRYASRVCEKLRAQRSVTSMVNVSIRTSPFNNEPFYQRDASLVLAAATADTRQVVKTAKRLLSEIYRSGYAYQHAGVTLSRIQPEQQMHQHDLFSNVQTHQSKALMATLDAINRRFPRGLAISTSDFNPQWRYQPERTSPRYTSHWQELAHVKC